MKRVLRWTKSAWAPTIVATALAAPLAAQSTPGTLREAPIDLSPLLSAPVDAAAEFAPENLADAPTPADEHATDSDDAAKGSDGATGDVADESQADEGQLDGAQTTEVVRERYPNREVKIEREVVQDEYGNYVNHGVWKQFDEQGNLVAQGEYKNGNREGVWHRWHKRDESPLFAQVPFNQFQGSFISQAKFVAGKLDGHWIVFDAQQNKIADWAFVDGKRHGLSVWWYAGGRKMREINYVDGEVDGFAREWGPDDKLLADDKYEQGRKIATKTSYHTATQKKAEGTYLFAKIVQRDEDDWWNAKPATFTRQGKDVKHGLWTSWYPNGQEHIQGEYKDDEEVGKFTWWFQNGQKALEGHYREGKAHGRWTWWHESGQKATQGSYEYGQLAGRWLGWTTDGKLARQEDHGSSAGSPTLASPPSSEPTPAEPQIPVPVAEPETAQIRGILRRS